MSLASAPGMRIVALACLALVTPAPSVVAPCADVVPVWADGAPAGTICASDAAARGLTIVDLADDWTPVALAPEGDDDAPAYRATYLALAAERFDEAGEDGVLARGDRYLELFGIEPTLSIVRARLDDDARHACHAHIDPIAIATAPATDAAHAAVRAHLACDGLDALAAFQRGQMILPHAMLDDDTRVALLTDSRERDFRTVLRVLRERVVAATGLLEDGTAGTGEGLVLGRTLEPRPTWRARGYEPLDEAAPDLISPATERAARALGWTDPAATRRALDAHGAFGRVAIALPPPPAYHAPHMALSAEIDRGDVWRDPAPRAHDAARRPALILYATDGARRIALVRWPTTIGGWQDEQRGDAVAPRWKESPVGARVWRDLFIGPTWLAPDSTPDRELDPWALGPGYRSAYGLVMLVHHAPQGRALDDDGLRTHGTGNLPSLASGISHGCHRLLGVQAMRLAGFLIAHRVHVRHGPISARFRRVVHGVEVVVDTRGDRIELTPPVPVEVLPGRARE